MPNPFAGNGLISEKLNHVCATNSCHVVICSSTETDDEPPCEEEIDYNTDSCSDQEVSELDAQPEDNLSEDDHGARKGQSPTLNKNEPAFSAKYNCSTRKSLTMSSKQYGCSPEASSSQCEQSLENSSKSKVDHYLYWHVKNLMFGTWW